MPEEQPTVPAQEHLVVRAEEDVPALQVAVAEVDHEVGDEAGQDHHDAVRRPAGAQRRPQASRRRRRPRQPAHHDVDRDEQRAASRRCRASLARNSLPWGSLNGMSTWRERAQRDRREDEHEGQHPQLPGPPGATLRGLAPGAPCASLLPSSPSASRGSGDLHRAVVMLIQPVDRSSAENLAARRRPQEQVEHRSHRAPQRQPPRPCWSPPVTPSPADRRSSRSTDPGGYALALTR